LPQAGLALLPVGLFAFDGDGRVLCGLLSEDDPTDPDPAAWRYRVKTALEDGALTPAALAGAWREACNDVTWGVKIDVEDLPDGVSFREWFKRSMVDLEGEHYFLLAEGPTSFTEQL
jgi:hypothetical protein